MAQDTYKRYNWYLHDIQLQQKNICTIVRYFFNPKGQFLVKSEGFISCNWRKYWTKKIQLVWPTVKKKTFFKDKIVVLVLVQPLKHKNRLVTSLRDQKEIMWSDLNKNTWSGLFNILLIFHIFELSLDRIKLYK